MSLLINCLLEESRAIANAAKEIDEVEVEKAINLLLKCSDNKNKLVVTGVGKSGIVSRKIAATFSSVGLMAIYLNPVDALHGDLGIISNNDVCLLLSNSGETQEIISLIPHLKKRGIKTIALVGNKKSTIARKSNVILEANVDKEICPLNLAPTASTSVAMAIGDALAVVWMQKNGISIDDFAINHPAGQLGKKLTLTVSDLMRPVDFNDGIFPTSSFKEIITKITIGGAGFTWVRDQKNINNLLGLITDGDLRRSLSKYDADIWNELCAKDLMTFDPIFINQDKLGVEAVQLMEHNRKKPISILPVTNSKGFMVGFLKLHDLIEAGLS
tara:strand:+ start:10239 stop:11225 length:987 start_codon:yes stop_codon:yes gene_type:complete